MSVRSFLSDYPDLYTENPRAAALKLPSEARFRLVMHYGLDSLLGCGEWVQLRGAIRLAERMALNDLFAADNFDTDFITEMSMDAGMSHVNIISHHHDSIE